MNIMNAIRAWLHADEIAALRAQVQFYRERDAARGELLRRVIEDKNDECLTHLRNDAEIRRQSELQLTAMTMGQFQ